MSLFVQAAPATIMARSRREAIVSLAEILDAALVKLQPVLDTPERSRLADDLAMAVVDDAYEEPDADDQLDLAERYADLAAGRV